MADFLLSPVTIGDLELPNRVVMAPFVRERAGPSKIPNEIMKKYYEQRAAGGTGLIIAEASAISEQGYGWYSAPAIYTEEHAEAWKPIVDTVHSYGTKFFMQLWHMGRSGHPTFNSKNEVVAPSAIQDVGHDRKNANGEWDYCALPRALELHEIPGIVEDYRKAAVLAKKAGFDGIEIHAANGYILDTFMQSSTNFRTDNYGGSFENRFRMFEEVIRAVSQVYPTNRIGVRISPNGVYGGMGSADNDQMFKYAAEQFRRLNIAYIHISDGLGMGFHNLCPRVTLFDMKQHFGGTVIGNIGYTRDTAEGAIRSGAADLISFGILFITNPDLVKRFANNWPLTSTDDWIGDDYQYGEKNYTDFSNYRG
jgi:N-ethylmaleimide reductase